MTTNERIEHQRALARARNAKYRAVHFERVHAARVLRRDDKRAKEKAYREAHPKYVRALSNARNAKYRATHPDKSRAYSAMRRVTHREQILQAGKAYRAAHREEIKAYRALKDREAVRAYMKAYIVAHRRANRGYYNALSKQRAAIKRQALPPWADKTAIMAIYREATRLTRETGIPHEVDHVYPLRGVLVSGLHCEANLRVVTRSINRQKSNKHPMSAEAAA